MIETQIKTGTTFKMNNDRRLYHVCGFVDNDKAIVWKYYGIYKQWWHYEVDNLDSFIEGVKIGLYKVVRY